MPELDAQNLSQGALFHKRYRIVRSIKSGGMGTVYEVRDENTASPRALKVMLPSVLNDADQRARFMREAKLTGSIESDHIVRVSDSGVDESSGAPFLVMELLRGQELGDIIEAKGALPPKDVTLYLSQAARALDKTHDAGIVHRDLKPSNLFLASRDDGTPCIKILDFGIAKISAQNEANKTRALGTPLYMSPEQIRGEGNLRRNADIYALAHVAYALLVGEPYWQEESQQNDSIVTLLIKVVGGQFPEAPSTRARRRKNITLPPAFDAWFYKATALAPEQRFERAGDAIAALSQALSAPAHAHAGHEHAAHHPHPVHHAHHAHTAPVAAQSAQVPYPAQPGHSPSWTPPQAQGYPAPPQATYAPAWPQAPAPALPQSTPKSSRLPLFLGAGFVMALGSCAAIIALGGSGDSKASNTPIPTSQGNSVPANTSCPADAICSPVDVPKPTSADAVAALPQIQRIAQKENPNARLIRITIAGPNAEGLGDITGDLPIQYQYGTPEQSLNISLRTGQAIVRKGAGLATAFALDEPKCAQKAAFQVALKNGFPAKGAGISLTYTADPSDGAAAWLINGPNQMVIIDGKSCALKNHTKW